MGRWTPLVLMAGGLAILLGTLLGISFPMDGRNAQAPESPGKESSVLPANINVNSTTAKQSPANGDGSTTVAQSAEGTDPERIINPANRDTSGTEQNQDNAQTVVQNGTAEGTGGDGTGDGTGEETGGEGTDAGNNGEPIRALW